MSSCDIVTPSNSCGNRLLQKPIHKLKETNHGETKYSAKYERILVEEPPKLSCYLPIRGSDYSTYGDQPQNDEYSWYLPNVFWRRKRHMNNSYVDLITLHMEISPNCRDPTLCTLHHNGWTSFDKSSHSLVFRGAGRTAVLSREMYAEKSCVCVSTMVSKQLEIGNKTLVSNKSIWKPSWHIDFRRHTTVDMPPCVGWIWCTVQNALSLVPFPVHYCGRQS